MPCVYIIYSDSTKKHYVGSSREDSAEMRITAHNAGRTKSTKFGKPWKLLFQENYPDYTSARKRELFLKSGLGRKYIKENFK
jgi:putative endonuclease